MSRLISRLRTQIGNSVVSVESDQRAAPCDGEGPCPCSRQQAFSGVADGVLRTRASAGFHSVLFKHVFSLACGPSRERDLHMLLLRSGPLVRRARCRRRRVWRRAVQTVRPGIQFYDAAVLAGSTSSLQTRQWQQCVRTGDPMSRPLDPPEGSNRLCKSCLCRRSFQERVAQKLL